MIQKYTHYGSKLLQQIGKKGVFDTSDGTTKGTPRSTPWPGPDRIFFRRHSCRCRSR
jgi:hypothetical protein